QTEMVGNAHVRHLPELDPLDKHHAPAMLRSHKGTFLRTVRSVRSVVERAVAADAAVAGGCRLTRWGGRLGPGVGSGHAPAGRSPGNRAVRARHWRSRGRAEAVRLGGRLRG